MRVMLTVVCLFGLAISAFAECAWVLWEHQFVPGSSPVDMWVIRAAWPDWNPCKN